MSLGSCLLNLHLTWWFSKPSTLLAALHRTGRVAQAKYALLGQGWDGVLEVGVAVSTSTAPHMVSSQTNYSNGSLVKFMPPKEIAQHSPRCSMYSINLPTFCEKWPTPLWGLFKDILAFRKKLPSADAFFLGPGSGNSRRNDWRCPWKERHLDLGI